MADAIRTFLAQHSLVRLRESGRVIGQLDGSDAGFSLVTDATRLLCHFWGTDTNLVRRVVAVSDAYGAGRLRLQCLRLGRSRAEPLDLEIGAPISDLQKDRQMFRQAIEHAVLREWRGWQLESGPWVAGAARSAPQRLLLRRGGQMLPCLAISETESASATSAVLAHALVWTEQVRESWPKAIVKAVRLILPGGAERELAERCRWLRQPPAAPPIECFRLDRSAGSLHPVELVRDGNLASCLRAAPPSILNEQLPSAPIRDVLQEVRELCPQTTIESAPDGQVIFRHYGLEFARASTVDSAITFGLGGERTPLTALEHGHFLHLVAQLGRQRVPGGNHRDWMFSLQPERWLEHILRADPSSLVPQLASKPVYAQVPVCHTHGREVLDLLAIDHNGRLQVLELKADEDLGFPLQALDYWARVRRHLEDGDFQRMGYFPGQNLSSLCPRLLLIAPSLRWHPRSDAILGWLSPDVPWVRIGINEEWRHGLHVVYRREAAHA